MPLAPVPVPALSSDQTHAQGGGLQSRWRTVTPGHVARKEHECGGRAPAWLCTTVTPGALHGGGREGAEHWPSGDWCQSSQVECRNLLYFQKGAQGFWCTHSKPSRDTSFKEPWAWGQENLHLVTALSLSSPTLNSSSLRFQAGLIPASLGCWKDELRHANKSWALPQNREVCTSP